MQSRDEKLGSWEVGRMGEGWSAHAPFSGLFHYEGIEGRFFFRPQVQEPDAVAVRLIIVSGRLVLLPNDLAG